MNKNNLRFKNGKFKILCFSDSHGRKDFDKRVVRDIEAIVNGTNPDLVLFLGDNVWADGAENEETLRNFMRAVVKPLNDKNIPWANVIGNHDEERGFPAKEQMKVYESLDGCISSCGPEELYGAGNWVLEVKGENSDETKYAVWGLYSGRGIGEFMEKCGISRDSKQIHLPDPLYFSSGYDVIQFEQIMWYWQKSVEMEKKYGKKIPGMMGFHIALPEYYLLYKNVQLLECKGNCRESVGSGPVNTGLFATLVQRGDVKTVVCGHDHLNDYEGTYLGVKLTYDGGIGYDGYCAGDMRGGRIIEVDENDPWNAKTYMVRSSQFVEDYEFEST